MHKTTTFGLALVLLAVWTPFALGAQDNFVTTVAGSGEPGFGGDGGISTDAIFNLPGSVAVDSWGNLYIADLQNQRIRKIGPNGVITTVAGNGERGFSGDGGPATEAALNLPAAEKSPDGRVSIRWGAGIHVDAKGNLFIADAGNNRIRRVGLDGVIHTVAGGGSGPLYTYLSSPSDVFVDESGTMYIADSGNRSIRKINPDGTMNTIEGFWMPLGVAADAEGNVYVADAYFYYEGMIFKVDAGGKVAMVASSGSPTPPYWFSPSDVTVGGSGDLVAAHTGNQSIDRVLGNGQVLRIAGGGDDSTGNSENGVPAESALFSSPRGVAVDRAGAVYVADTLNHRIRVIAPSSPTLALDSSSCTGSKWSLKLGNVVPGSAIRLLGTSQGAAWEIPQWRTAYGDGTLVEEGTFSASTRGIHTLRVEAGGRFSNPITFTVHDCQP